MRKSLLLLLGCLTLASYATVRGQTHSRDLADYLSPSTPDLPVVSAHRGGRFYRGFPENSLSLFKHISSTVPVFIECDIQMSTDSVLFLMHDDSLDRTTTGTGLARSQSWEELQHYVLVDDFGEVTTEKIPSLENVFRWAKGTYVLALDIKEGVPVDYLVRLIRDYEVDNDVLLIAYSLEEAVELHQFGPDLVLSVSMYEISDIDAHENAGIPLRQCVAFTGTKYQSPELYRVLREKGILSIVGTMYDADHRFRAGNEDVYVPFFDGGVDILATDHPIEATTSP